MADVIPLRYPSARGEGSPGGGSPTPLVTQTGSQLWLRRWQLSVGSSSGETAVDLSGLGFNFTIDRSQLQTPALAKITIFNPDMNVVSRLESELTNVDFQAGYQPPSQQYGKVFAGPIAYYKHGRLNATDTFVEITAVQLDLAMDHAIINTSLPAQHTPTDQVNACLDVMQQYGVTLGQITDLGSAKSPRGATLHGMPMDVLRDIAQSCRANAFIDADSRLNILKEGESVPGAVVVLNSKSGMIDVPTQTLGGGIEVRSLLNPAIQPGGQINVNQKDVTSYTAGVAVGELSSTAFALSVMALASDGFYTVASVRHWGQNRGNPWYTDIKTVPMDPTAQPIGIRTSG